MIELHRHPIRVLPALRPMVPAGARLWFSRYRYRPRTVKDDRFIFSVPFEEVTEDWLLKLLGQLGTEENLAFNSNLTCGFHTFHIPMIDFAGLSSDHLSALIEVFGERAADEFSFFSSGRSFHAYGCSLFDQRQWYEFMGKLLLCNFPGRPVIIDQRWVGHRLIGGYSALRWSCNGSNYRQYPQFIGNMVALSGLSKKEKKAKLAMGVG